MSLSQSAIVIMAKAPRAGVAKTRLSPALSQSQAASLAACFIRDTALMASQIASNVIVAYTPSDARPALEPIIASGAMWEEQQGADLGARLEKIIFTTAAQGFAPIVIVGTDSPTVPREFIRSAFETLENDRADLVLGPTSDGGYYMAGLRKPISGLFENIPWSTPLTYLRTMENAARIGLRVADAPMWFDVDTDSDLGRLRREMCEDERARLRAPATYEWLARNNLL